MSCPSASAAIGALAVTTSSALLVLHIILALPRSNPTSPTRTTAIVSSLSESAVLVLLSWILFVSCRKDGSRTVSGLLFGSSVVVCVVAAALTIATLICLSSSAPIGDSTVGFVGGVSALLALSFVAQLIFLVVRFIAGRTPEDGPRPSPSMLEIGRRSPSSRVKTVPYSSTSPAEPATRNVSIDSKSPPSSSGGFSATGTISSVASSLTNVVRPISSKTKLLSGSRSMRSQRSQRSQRRPPSLESIESSRSGVGGVGESFDSWDTSSVDAQNRQTVLDSSSPATQGRFLETIPASPTTSRSPSPGTPLDLEPPRLRRRSRSFSPASTRTQAPQPPQRAFTQQSSASESHIHPLFRSDSPTPPPLASPGTVVIAAPQAGFVISDRQSIRSLSRMRSDSLPVASSPLTRTGSVETLGEAYKSFSMASDGSKSEDSGDAGEAPERNVTPPIPDYILNAGSSTTSLPTYQTRKTQSREGPSGPGLAALDGAAW
ncbi:hypothetical protein DHEL01_v209448 [Diaporthe helianthi]|uniref:Uncharacterized protein n=1 Tax=Diaporthe helianthi TaxID=158607 RepID=A0A2P5HPG5_DIAHE|nr:hypothetical protein DHEL01_v209448 [Diaporthe helianthi]